MKKNVSRLLALAVLVLIPGAILTPIVLAVLEWRGAIQQQTDTASQILSKYGDQTSRVAALKETLEALEASAKNDDNLISGATDALASAALQTRAKQLIEAGGGVIQSLQILPAKAETTLSRITVRVQFAARSEDLQKIIYSIEAATPLLKIGALEIRQERLSSGPSATDAQLDGNLIVQIEVSGFRRVEQTL